MEGVTLEDASKTIARYGQYIKDDLIWLVMLVNKPCH